MKETMMVEKVEQPTEGHAPSKPAKAGVKKSVKKEKPRKQEDGIYLPVLVEFTFTSSVIFLIFVFLAITIVSWRAGVSLLDFILRTGIALGVLGSLLMVVSRQVSTGVLSASRAEIEPDLQAARTEEVDDFDVSENLDTSNRQENVENQENSKNMEISSLLEGHE